MTLIKSRQTFGEQTGLILLDFYLRFLFNLQMVAPSACHENSKWQGAIKRFIANEP